MKHSQVIIQKQPFDVGDVVNQLYRDNPQVGAVASFLGICRDINDGESIGSMRLEHYPEMTEKSIQTIIETAREKWQFFECVVIHRVGVLRPTDPIVLVAVSSQHRQQALDVCAYVMDFLKTRAPFWKHEDTERGQRWVTSRESDIEAANRWK